MDKISIPTLCLAHMTMLILMETAGTSVLIGAGLSEYRADKLSYVIGASLLCMLYIGVLRSEGQRTVGCHTDFSMTAIRQWLEFGAAVALCGIGLIGLQVYLVAVISPDLAASFWTFGGSNPKFGPDNTYLGLNSSFISMTLFILVQMVAAPVAEELLFRGIVLRRLIRVYTPAIAIFVTSVIFTFVHKERQWLSTLAFSVVIGLFYIRHGSLWAVAFIHGMNNLLTWLYQGFGGMTYLESKSPEDLALLSSWIPDLVASAVGLGWCAWILLRTSPPTPTAPSPGYAARDPDQV